MKQKTIYVAILNQGEIRTDLVQVINMMIQNDSYRIRLSYPVGKPICNNRNTTVQKFLASKDCDYLMMIDSDICPPPNILSLIDFQKDIITPLMFVQQKGMNIPLFLHRNKDGIYDADDYLNKTGLQETDATGTGCIILSRKVLEDIKHPFRNEYDADGVKILGNDLSFCQRAKEKGYKVWVHLDYIASHYYVTDLKDQFYEALGKWRAEKELFVLKKHLEEKSPKLFEEIMEKVKSETLTLKIGQQKNEDK
jgi:hypothetical protein